jgi:hypothetical protein
MRLMPETFLYDYDGFEGNLVRLKFRPIPSTAPDVRSPGGAKPGWKYSDRFTAGRVQVVPSQ